MLMSETLERIIRVLLAEKGRRFSLRTLSLETGANLSRVAVEINRLCAAGYVEKQRGVKVAKESDLQMFFAYAWAFNDVPAMNFETLDRAPFIIKRIHEIGTGNGLDYAFTMLAGAELVAPYVIPTTVHFYIEPTAKDKWLPILEKNDMYPVEQRGGKVTALLWDPHILCGKMVVRGMNVVSLPQLFADLFSSGGMFRDAAMRLREVVPGV